ncbi:MAG: hypothetical protein LUE27_02470 [Clostridia bacterium]|nr:hypothetical protein [Clostridia bacterium]
MRYQHFVTVGKTICMLVQQQDSKALFRVITDNLLGTDLRLETRSKEISIDDINTFTMLIKNADGGLNIKTASDGRVTLELWFLNAYKVVGVIR